MPIIFLIFYEILPQATCLTSGGVEIFSNIIADKIGCNTIYENIVLFSAFVALSIFALRKINLNIKFKKSRSSLYRAVMKFKILLISIVAITGIITIASTLGVSERAELFEIHQRIFANPLTYPFVHLSIFICFVDYVITGKRLAPAALIGIITLTCIFTQSRSLIMMAVLPYVLVVDKKYLFTLGVALVPVFFMRDLIKGSPVEVKEFTLSSLPLIFGEFFNTWGGRRIMVDSFKNFPLDEYVMTSISNLTGIKYLFYPLNKISAAAGLDTGDHVIQMNLLLYENFGFNGVAGSFLSDFTFFPMLSLFICSLSLFLFVKLYKNEENSYVKLIILIYSIAFMHHLFRWSATNYLTSLVGIFIVLIIVKNILISINKVNTPLG